MINNTINFSWNDVKNKQLKTDRGLCFEDFIIQVSQDNILDIIKHPNSTKYPSQYIYIVELQGYVCMIPCVKSEAGVFLKTIIPSRKMHKKYRESK
ncbi:hypothetical protein SPBRAN_1985 [uncultured Candidatus Thioglobus sp.]|nr:hypothetical protein SPBRAN_1985 [uncultured Candidatus Thioglobus sp.]